MGLVILGSWQQGERKYSGGEAGSRARGVGHFCLVFRNEHTVRRASHIPKVKSESITLPSRVDILGSREESDVLIHPG
jgi:hypothetical protein